MATRARSADLDLSRVRGWWAAWQGLLAAVSMPPAAVLERTGWARADFCPDKRRPRIAALRAAKR